MPAFIETCTNVVTPAISISGPSLRVTKERIAELASHVVRAADEIAAGLGYRIPSNGAGKAPIRKLSVMRPAEWRPSMKVESFDTAVCGLAIKHNPISSAGALTFEDGPIWPSRIPI